MRDIANRLERLGCINRDMRLAQALTEQNSDRLLALRADFAFECNQLFNQLTAKLANGPEAQVASRILNAFVSMQHALLRHQHKWSADEIADDTAMYHAQSRNIQAQVINFLEDALEAIEASAQPMREQMVARRPIAPPAPVRLTGTR